MERYLALQKVVDLGSFTKAAEALGYSQSSVSQMIASLENELGIKLLNRSRYGITLSPEGKDLYGDIEKLIYQYQAVQERTAEIKGLQSGVVRIGTISSITCHWMPGLIAGFKETYPNVQFIMPQGDYSLIPEWIRSGRVDCGFITPPIAGELQTVPVKDGEMLAVLPESHRLARKSVLTLQDIAQEPFIELEEGQYSEPLEAFRAAGITPNIQYRMHDDYAIMAMVESGLGISILAELILRRTHYHNVCRSLDPPIYRHLCLAYKKKDSLPLACRYFIDYLLARKDELP